MSRTAPRLRRLIDALAASYDMPSFVADGGVSYHGAELLEAMVLVGSGGDPSARRYERALDAPGRHDATTDADRPGFDDGDCEDDARYGLLAVRGAAYRLAVGAPVRTPLHYRRLFRPAFNLAVGCEIFRGLLTDVCRQRPGAQDDECMGVALARYFEGVSTYAEEALAAGVWSARVADACAKAREDRLASDWVTV